MENITFIITSLIILFSLIVSIIFFSKTTRLKIKQFIEEFINCLHLEKVIEKRIIHVYITEKELKKEWKTIIEIVLKDQSKKKYLLKVQPNIELEKCIKIDSMNVLFVHLNDKK